jgi:hypothetical protein
MFSSGTSTPVSAPPELKDAAYSLVHLLQGLMRVIIKSDSQIWPKVISFMLFCVLDIFIVVLACEKRIKVNM